MLPQLTRHLAAHRIWLAAATVAALTAGTISTASAATIFKIDIDSTDGGSLQTESGVHFFQHYSYQQRLRRQRGPSPKSDRRAIAIAQVAATSSQISRSTTRR